VFNGGEEFIHLFTINPEKFDSALKVINANGGQIYKIGKVISEAKIYYLKESKKFELKSRGFEHFK
jgi:thiamine monophosphate kinase